MAVYGKAMSIDEPFEPDQLFMRVYVILTYISGVMYFLSTCINPLLYNIMSNKFRAATKVNKLTFSVYIQHQHVLYVRLCIGGHGRLSSVTLSLNDPCKCLFIQF